MELRPGRIFWHISLPLIKPVLTVMGLLGTVWAMNTFDVIWLTTRGGPGSVSKTLPVLVYEVGFQKLFLARSATISVLAFAVLGIFGAVFIWLNRRDLFGEGGHSSGGAPHAIDPGLGGLAGACAPDFRPVLLGGGLLAEAHTRADQPPADTLAA